MGSDWDSAASKYSELGERLTKAPVQELIALVDSRSSFKRDNVKVLDDGCGTGVLTSALTHRFPDVSILAVDVSSGMLDALKKQNLPNVETKVVDSTDMASAGIEDQSFTHVLSSFMNQFAPAPQKTVEEMHRVLRDGGVLGLGTWGTLDVEKPWEDAVRQVVDPMWQSPGGFESWPQEVNGVKQAVEAAGFKEVEVKKMKTTYGFKTYEEVAQYVFEAGNPAIEKIVGALRKHEKFSEIRNVWEEKMKEAFADPGQVGAEAFLTVGTK